MQIFFNLILSLKGYINNLSSLFYIHPNFRKVKLCSITICSFWVSQMNFASITTCYVFIPKNLDSTILDLAILDMAILDLAILDLVSFLDFGGHLGYGSQLSWIWWPSWIFWSSWIWRQFWIWRQSKIWRRSWIQDIH